MTATDKAVPAALLLEAPGQLVVDEIVVDRPVGHEVLVRTAAAGCCHSDLHVMKGRLPAALPAVMGHEASGVVLAIGDDVDYVVPGDHVVGCLAPFCGHCDYCLSGRMILCQASIFQRPATARPRLSYKDEPVHQYLNLSAFAEEMLVHENALVRIDSSIPLDHAALVGCAVTTGIGAVVHSAQVQAGTTMAVIGCGGVGLNIVQGGRLVGARTIVAVDTSAEKLELAHRFGATATVDASKEDPVAAVRWLTGDGVDYSFEALGTKGTVEQSIAVLRHGGVATIAGVMASGTTFEMGGHKLIDGAYRIQGSKLGSAQFRIDMPRYLQLYLQGRIDLEGLISQRIGLDDVNSAYAALERGATARSLVLFKPLAQQHKGATILAETLDRGLNKGSRRGDPDRAWSIMGDRVGAEAP